MAGNLQMVINSRWAVLPSMDSMSGFLSATDPPAPAGPRWDVRRGPTPGPGRDAAPPSRCTARRGCRTAWAWSWTGYCGPVPWPKSRRPPRSGQTAPPPGPGPRRTGGCRFWGAETGVGEGSPEVWSVAGQGVVETAGAQEPEVGHPEFAGGRHVLRRADPPAAQQVWCQAVDRLQHGQVETVWNAPLLCGFRRWFASLAANPGSCTEEPHWDSKTGGDIGNRHGGVAFAGTP